ncbi:hypothetical protein EVAR_61084_1 [Eumeta japonica]|uniref:Uncharacterized protein n=1 Tax=Eumeta variegata TaxID=151549 RepID=A0A4C1YQ99_EUMVA|nr:hypothetical protein EVAR_61084_1 [Eumeta japonica]
MYSSAVHCVVADSRGAAPRPAPLCRTRHVCEASQGATVRPRSRTQELAFSKRKQAFEPLDNRWLSPPMDIQCQKSQQCMPNLLGRDRMSD